MAFNLRRLAGAASTSLSYIAVAGALAAQLLIAPPVQASDQAVSQCQENGGSWVSGRCDYGKNNDFDLFSAVILGALVLTGLRVFEKDRDDRPQGRQAPPPPQRR